MSDLFEKASKLKVRYESPAGLLSVDDLWDLPLTSTVKKANLDDLAIYLNKELKESDTTSFVNKTTKTNELTKLKFDVVLRVIEVRKAEDEAASLKRVNKEKKQKLLELISQKQDESLKSKSVEELQTLVNEL